MAGTRLAGSVIYLRSFVPLSNSTNPANRRLRLRAGATLGAIVLAGAALAVGMGLARAFGGDPGGPCGGVLAVRAPHVVILKAKRQLHLLDGDRLIRSYPIDLGLKPTGEKRVKGDSRTPVGSFHVVTRNAGSGYHRFIGIDYPNEEAVRYGLDHGLVSPGEAKSVRAALKGGRRPNWSTALGGGIGIHGHRRGRDWTGGCVAVSDKAIEELFDVLRLGDPIEIFP